MSTGFSERSKLELECIIKKLNEDTFDEDDIKSLLLQWRAYFKSSSLIWEFACFISHPEERSKVIFHKELDVKYTQMIYGRAIGGPFNKSFNPNVVEPKLFNTLLIGGIETIESDYLKSITGLTKIQARDFIYQSYMKKGNLFYIRPKKEYKKLEKIINAILSLVSLTPAIKNEEIIKQFKNALTETITILELSLNSNEIIEKNKHKIIICLMCLLHSHNFILFDKKKGACKLDINRGRNNKWAIYLYANISDINIHWPLMEFEDDLHEHIEELPEINNSFEPFKLKGFNAIRKNNRLVITNKNNY